VKGLKKPRHSAKQLRDGNYRCKDKINGPKDQLRKTPMSVRFILGRSGTGKTSYCTKAITDAVLAPGEQSLILLVPEQATYQAERAILSDESIAGYHRLHVLSFDRLAFLLAGRKTARPALSRIGQQMIIHKLLRDNSSKLKVLGESANWTGLGRRMAETIRELYEYANTPDDVETLLDRLRKGRQHTLAELKFADIGLIFGQYVKGLEGKFTDPDIQLRQACAAVAKADFIKDARLWVDGFAGFTTSELVLLTELLKTVADAEIALCLDPSKLDLVRPDAAKLEPTSLFSPTEQTYASLVETINKCKLTLVEPLLLNQPVRFAECPQLAHVERNIFESKPAQMDSAENIQIVAAPNARSEVQFVAGHIVQLVREQDYRYRDIAVIASDLDRYRHYVNAYFADYDIPFFIDTRKPLDQHPVVQLICSGLQVVAGGFNHYDVFAYLKIDLVPIGRGDVDLLENYCVAFGIGPADWQSEDDWQYAGAQDRHFDERCISRIRRELSRPLLELQDKLGGSDNKTEKITARQFTRMVFEFLESLGVRQQLAQWIEQAGKAADHTAIEEHRQLYDKVLTVFDEMVEVFGDQPMAPEDYLAILNSAFSQLTLAFIPPSLDQVLVGSIERSRHPDLKAVFLIGATQGQFPSAISTGGMLTDEDRAAAESSGFSLAASTRQRLTERQYLAYIAFTRPWQFLCVTYPLLNEKNSPQCRSQFVDNLQSLFDGLQEQSVGSESVNIENVHSKSELADRLYSSLGKDAPRARTPDLRALLAALLDDPGADEQFADLGLKVASAMNYDNRARLDSDVVDSLFGRQLSSSATRLGTFAACPYQHFARYLLKLEKRREFKFEPLDLGNFYHRVLDCLFKKLKAEGKDIATLPDEQIKKSLAEQIQQLIRIDPFISNFMRHSPHNTFIINSAAEVLEDCVLAIAKMVRTGGFRPTRSEVAFGRAKDAAEKIGEFKMRLADGRTLTLNGKIDRIDIAEIDGKESAVVFDYKRRPKSFNWSQFYHGLDMQLAIYMLAVRSTKNVADVAGAFYMPIEISPEKTTLEGLPTESSDYRAKGVFDGRFYEHIDNQVNSGWSKFYNFRITKKDGQYGDPGKSGALRPADFEKALEFAERKIAWLAEEILSGKIDVHPYRLGVKSPCSYCDYKPVCRFDWQINSYNPLEPLSKIAVLEKAGAGRI
jgi:ATP-dependent helicase/nuclease subunit B